MRTGPKSLGRRPRKGLSTTKSEKIQRPQIANSAVWSLELYLFLQNQSVKDRKLQFFTISAKQKMNKLRSKRITLTLCETLIYKPQNPKPSCAEIRSSLPRRPRQALPCARTSLPAHEATSTGSPVRRTSPPAHETDEYDGRCAGRTLSRTENHSKGRQSIGR